jgi:hypothetical protein
MQTLVAEILARDATATRLPKLPITREIDTLPH